MISECARDADCLAGQTCYLCANQPGQCLQGCNAQHPCPGGQTCRQLGVACFTCPCIDSVCEGTTCTDDDGDGYVAGPGCSGKPGGDCAPFDPTVNPAQGEQCNNGTDDDCDGLIDASDPQCGQPLCMGAPSCQTSWNCNLGTTSCDLGCCMSCPVYAPPRCMTGECLAPVTIAPTSGCQQGPECRTCPTTPCPAVYAPVCGAFSERGVDPRTFGNTCEAAAWGAIVIHPGACLQGEGLNCGSLGMFQGCGPGVELYCRDACPECDADMRRCTAKGVCFTDLDCPAGLTAPPQRTCVDGTLSRLRCVSHACVQACN